MRIDVEKNRVPVAFRDDLAMGEGRTLLRIRELKDFARVAPPEPAAIGRALAVAVARAEVMSSSPVVAVAAQGQSFAAELHKALIDQLCASDCTCLPDGGCIDYYDEDRPGDCAWCASQQGTDGTCPAVAWPRPVDREATR